MSVTAIITLSVLLVGITWMSSAVCNMSFRRGPAGAVAVASTSLLIILMMTVALGLYNASGQPRVIGPFNNFSANRLVEAQIMSHVLREDEGIYLWVMDTRNPDAEPLSLKLPWSDATAQALSDAKGDADGPQGEGDLFMEWSQEPSLNDVPQFYGRPWPALPNKPVQEPALRVPERAA